MHLKYRAPNSSFIFYSTHRYSHIDAYANKNTSVRAGDEPPNIGWSHSRKWQLMHMEHTTKAMDDGRVLPLNKDTFM